VQQLLKQVDTQRTRDVAGVHGIGRRGHRDVQETIAELTAAVLHESHPPPQIRLVDPDQVATGQELEERHTYRPDVGSR